MNCSQCIWYQTNTSYIKSTGYLITKVSCNKRNKYLYEVSQEEKENCKHFKTAKDIEREWKEFESLIGANL